MGNAGPEDAPHAEPAPWRNRFLSPKARARTEAREVSWQITASGRSSSGNEANPLRRPVAMLSFALNFYFSGADTFYFKLSNLIIHLLTGAGLYSKPSTSRLARAICWARSVLTTSLSPVTSSALKRRNRSTLPRLN